MLSSCVNVKIISDPGARFDEYTSFCWFQGCEFEIDGPDYLKSDSSTVEEFRTSIVQELEKKGYVLDDESPDFLLYMHVVVDEEIGYLRLPRWLSEEEPPPNWQGEMAGQQYIYLKGSLIIDMADVKSSEMIWRADAVEYFDLTQEIDQRVIEKGVKRALRKFPKRASK